MTTDNTVRLSLRLKVSIYKAIEQSALEKGIEINAFIQDALQKAVYTRLSEAERLALDNANALYDLVQERARALFHQGKFDEHFTLTVFQDLISSAESRQLYETVIGDEALAKGAPGKKPHNMYLGWHIKNAVGAEPLLDERGEPKRAFVKDEAIQSYTLLKMPLNGG